MPQLLRRRANAAPCTRHIQQHVHDAVELLRDRLDRDGLSNQNRIIEIHSVIRWCVNKIPFVLDDCLYTYVLRVPGDVPGECSIDLASQCCCNFRRILEALQFVDRDAAVIIGMGTYAARIGVRIRLREAVVLRRVTLSREGCRCPAVYGSAANCPAATAR